MTEKLILVDPLSHTFALRSTILKIVAHFSGWGIVAKFTDKKDFTKIPNDLIRSVKVSGNDFKIFCFIASYNPSFPSVKHIADTIGIDRKTVMRSIKRLEKIGLITVNREFGKSNRYKINYGFTLKKPVPKKGPVPKLVLGSPKIGTGTSPKIGTLKRLIEKEQIKSDAPDGLGKENFRQLLKVLKSF